MRKILILIVSVIALYSCKGIIYDYAKIIEPNLYAQKMLGNDNIIITFTKNFKNDSIKIIQNDSIIYSANINTVNGIGGQKKIKKNANAFVFVNGEKIKLVPDKMSKYHFIYIYKNNKHIYVQFYDGYKNFRNDETFFSSHKLIVSKCRILDIDSTQNFYYISFKRNIIKNNNELIIVPKIDSIIGTRNIEVGSTYRFRLDDSYYNEVTSDLKEQNIDSLFYDKKFIWESESNRKFYTTDNLINLHYIK